ncbi:MAG: hypothetical protein IJL26_08030 [Clostridia bacterium]|nr:hypothetical protein [Clostridia bacterium]
MMKRKAIPALLAALALFVLAATPAFAAAAPVFEGQPVAPASAEQPSVSVTSGECKVGESVTVLLSMSNVTGFTAGDLHIEYNPHLVRLTKIEACDDINTRGVYHAETELVQSENELGKDGLPVHNFNLSVFHEEQFPQSLNDCELFRLTFTAISGGECPLVLGSSSFNINDIETYPLLHSGMIRIEGEVGLTWDYAKGVIDDVIYTDEAYPYAPLNPAVPRTYASTNPNGAKSGTNTNSGAEKHSGARIAIAVSAGIVIVGAIVAAVISSGKKKYVDE